MAKANRTLIFTGILCALALITMLFSLVQEQKQIHHEFTPPPFDPYARAGTPDVSEDMGWNEFDADFFLVSVCSKIRPSGNTADVWLTNPKTNDVWMKLRVLDLDGNLLGETGLIKPGEYLKEIQLNNLPAAGTPIVLKIMTYEPETYHSTGSISINTAIYN